MISHRFSMGLEAIWPYISLLCPLMEKFEVMMVGALARIGGLSL